MVVFAQRPSVSVVVEPSLPDTQQTSIQKLWRRSAVLGLLRNILPGQSFLANPFQRQLSDIDTSRQQQVNQPVVDGR